MESATAWRFGGLTTRLMVAVNDLAVLVCWQTQAENKQKKEWGGINRFAPRWLIGEGRSINCCNAASNLSWLVVAAGEGIKSKIDFFGEISIIGGGLQHACNDVHHNCNNQLQ